MAIFRVQVALLLISSFLSFPLQSGKLVPDDLIVRLVLDDVKNGDSQNLLLDGFPRTVVSFLLDW